MNFNEFIESATKYLPILKERLNNVVDTIKINRTIESILLPDNNDKIIEESISQKILIPFATDWGSCNFAIDLKCGHFIDSIDKIKEYLGDINE